MNKNKKREEGQLTPRQRQKEAEVLSLQWQLPEEYIGNAHRYIRNKNQSSVARAKHMKQLRSEGVSISQIARAYRVSRQRAHQIINSNVV